MDWNFQDMSLLSEDFHQEQKINKDYLAMVALT